MVIIGALLGCSIALIIICSGLLKWNELRFRKKGIPPGTMGWPLFGETTEFLSQGPSFMKTQCSRYGNLFKSHILGCPIVVSMDPELNRYVLMNEGKGLVPGYPQSMLDILGRFNIAAVSGSLHKAMRGSMLSLVNPTVVREQLLPKLDEFMRCHLSDWNGKVIDIQGKTKQMYLLSALKLIAGIENSPFSEALESEIYKLHLGTLSLPINLPGTIYHQGLEARKKIVNMLRKLIGDRRDHSGISNNDMLDVLLKNGGDSGGNFDDEQLIDQIITVIYAGIETVSTSSMMATKYINEHPAVLKELLDEYRDIQKRKLPDDAIDWNDYKSMKFTRAVILETSRLSTVVHGLLRKTTEDTELKGYTIPKGWRIYLYNREMNYDPFLYPEPFSFNPWRWLDGSLESHQYFMAFGGGSRLCPGKELGMVQVSMFLYYFVTRYRWEEVEGNKLLKFPRVEAPNGLHIRVWDR